MRRGGPRQLTVRVRPAAADASQQGCSDPRVAREEPVTRRAGAPALHREAGAPRAEAASDLQLSPGFGGRRPRVPGSIRPTGSSAAPEVGMTQRPGGERRGSGSRHSCGAGGVACKRASESGVSEDLARCTSATASTIEAKRVGSGPPGLRQAVASRAAGAAEGRPGDTGKGRCDAGRGGARSTGPGSARLVSGGGAGADGDRGYGGRFRRSGTSSPSGREVFSVGLCDPFCRGHWRTRVDDCGSGARRKRARLRWKRCAAIRLGTRPQTGWFTRGLRIARRGRHAPRIDLASSGRASTAVRLKLQTIRPR